MAISESTASGGPPLELLNAANRVDFDLPATAECVTEARRYVRQVLGTWHLASDSREAAALVVSELITNAVVHTDTRTVTCVLAATGHQTLIQVEDHGTGCAVPTPQLPMPDWERGRGLMLVEAMSRHWGTVPSENGRGGRVVWATLNTAAE
ncbi:ATP-binding protein [Streptomyces sp. NPDC004539]|uniref:ATP-binding protein n=1 Tax=Streptomyces sp. NPDC004539 TaxID=3154280 RepID=UPI0033A19EEC